MYIHSIIPLQPITTLADADKKPSNPQGNLPFSNVLNDAVQALKETQAESNAASYALAMGTTDDLAGVMIASAKATAALELTVEVSSRAMNAYKEIMQMQV